MPVSQTPSKVVLIAAARGAYLGFVFSSQCVTESIFSPFLGRSYSLAMFRTQGFSQELNAFLNAFFLRNGSAAHAVTAVSQIDERPFFAPTDGSNEDHLKREGFILSQTIADFDGGNFES